MTGIKIKNLKFVIQFSVAVGRNQPLKPDRHRWSSEVPWSRKKLEAEREEFWDTAPAYDGRREIWDALKAAADAVENGDVQLAQAILDGANVSLPNGTLMDCYDELGTHYSLPKYVVVPPNNLTSDEQLENTPKEERQESRCPPGAHVPIKFRLYGNRDVRLVVRTTDTVSAVKEQLCNEEGIEASKQRWYFSGRLLKDRMRIEEAKIPKGFVVQVIINDAPPSVSN